MKSSAVGILAFLALAFCWPILFTGGVVGNFGDIYQYAAPFRFLAQIGFQSGKLPLWNPYIFCGAPFLASPQSSLFYPGTALFCSLPLASAFDLFAAFHLFLNVFGFYLLLRHLRRSQSASLLGASAWGFSFFFLSKVAAGHVIHLSGYAWTPFCLLFLLRWLASPVPGSRDADFFALLCASALQFFSGHLQVWLYTSLFLALVVAREAWRRDEDGRADLGKGVLALSAALAAVSLVQSLPSLIYVLQSTRHRAVDLFGERTAYDFATSYSLPWKNLIGLVLPGFFGDPMSRTFVDAAHPSVYFETHALYLGLLPFALGLAALAWAARRGKLFLPLTAAAFLVLCAGRYSGIYPWIWKFVGFMRVPARLYLIPLIALTLGAAFAWDRWVRPLRPAFKTALFLLVALDLFFHGRKFVWSENYDARMGHSQAVEWLQDALYKSQFRTPVVDPVGGSPYRIFTTADIGNPNKSALFGMKNGNGYEAVLQRSLLEYFALTQKGSQISSTGVDVIRPERTSFGMTATRFLVSATPLDTSWPLRFESPSVKIYENPRPIFPARAAFSLRALPDLPSVLSWQDSDGYRGEILKEEPDLLRGLQPAGEQKKSLGLREDRPVKEAILLSFVRLDADRIVLSWKCPKPASFWVFLSEAYYPGWEVWTESGKKIDPFQANGYFQACSFEPDLLPYEKLYWVFRPADFRLGAWTSAFAAAALAILGLRALKAMESDGV